MRRFVPLALALALGLAACGGGSSTNDPSTIVSPTGSPAGGAGGTTSSAVPVDCTDPMPPADPPPALASPPTVEAGMGPVPATTQVTTLIKGAGPAVAQGDCVVVNYVGANYADGKVFDSSFSRGSAFELVAGGQGAIEGFSKGVVGVPVGSRVKLVIPAAEGYKADGSPPVIAPNENLIFVVDVLRIKTS